MTQTIFGLTMACAACLAGVARADVLEAEYSAAYATLTVRVTPGAVAVFDAAHLRTPKGEPGLLGEYFDMSRARDGLLKMEKLGDIGAGAEPVVSRIETRMDFPWGGGAPAGGIPDDWFAARWTGKLGPLPFAATLVTVTDDGVRLWLDGVKVIDDWVPQAPKVNATGEPLEAGRAYDVRLEYFEAEGGGSCRFGYRLPETLASAVRSAEITLTAPGGGEALKRRMTWEGERGELRLEIPDLPGGTYTVAAVLPGVPGAFTRTITIRGRAVETAKLDLAKGAYAGTFKVAGGATFTVDPPRVRVESARYVVEFIDLGISQITDKKTGQQYCVSGGMRPGRNASLALKTYMPGRPDPTFFHLPEEPDAQQTRVKRLKRGVEYTVTGLVAPGPDAETRRYHPEALLGLRIEFEAATGDLCITALGHAGVPEQFGVYDTGIFAVGFNVGTFKQGEIQFINPAGRASAVSDYKGWEAWWPVGYPVALMVFEAPGGGCAAVWADDPKLDYGKKFRIHDGTVRFEAVNGDAPWRVGAMEAPIWRLNLFDSWEPAALRYREVMERTLGIKKIAERLPERGRTIRTALHAEGWRASRLPWLVEQGVPAEALMAWETQGWLAGYGVELLSKKRDLWFPNYPFERPTHYLGSPGFAKNVKQSQDFGVPVFPYTLMFYGMSQPFEKDSRVLRAPDMDFTGAGRMWWTLYTNLIKDLAERYGLQGMYLDCSWVGPRYDPRGIVDGLTVWQAHVLGRQYMKERMSPVILYGERQHEITMVSDFIALLWVWGEVHPINHYLFGPYTWRFNTGGGNDLNATLDANESLGAIPWVTGDPFASTDRQERAVFNKYLLFWGQERLTPFFPERYKPDVLAYFRGKDGVEYRTKRGGGMGLVRVKKGAEEIVWWRTAKAAEFRSPAASIDGWVAYDGERIIGLNPERRYAILEEHPRPDVTIGKLPEGAWLSLSRIGKGFWVAAVSGTNLSASVELEIRSGGKKLSVVGAEVAGPPSAAGNVRIRVAPGALFAACWDRAPQDVASLPTRLEPASRMEFVGEAGLPVLSREVEGGANTATNGTVWWRSDLRKHALQADYLISLPKAPVVLKAAIVDDGKVKEAGVRVLANGKVIADVKHEPGKPTPLRASLAAFAGQTVLLTFDGQTDGALGIQNPSLIASE